MKTFTLEAAVLIGSLAAMPGAAAEPALPDSLPASTQATEEAMGETFRQEVVVTATHPEIASRAIEHRELLRGSPSDLGEALRAEPGLEAWRRGPINLDPSVRGLQETQIGLFVDGTRTFAAGPGRMDSGLSHVSPDAVARLQVIKGPYALTWGAGTLAAIEVDTRRPVFTEELDGGGRLSSRYSDNGERGGIHAEAWAAGERFRFLVNAGRREGSDYETGAGEVIPAGYESDDIRWSLDWRPTTRSMVEYSGGDQRQDDIDYYGRQLDALYFDTRSHSLQYTFQPAGQTIERFVIHGYSNRKRHRMNNDAKPTARANPNRMPPFAIEVDVPTESDTTGGRAQIAGNRNSWSWLVGTDVMRLEQTANRTIRRRETGMLMFEDIVWPDAELEDLGVYTQLTGGGERLTLSATARGDMVEARAGETSEFFSAYSDVPLDRSETNLSLALSARLQASERTTWLFGLGSAVRPATPLERYSDRFPSSRFQVTAEFVGDPGLSPERSSQLDVGFTHGGDLLNARAEIFARRIDDYITVTPAPEIPKHLPMGFPTVYRYVNGEAEFLGAEASLLFRATDSLSLRTTAQWLRGDDTTFDEPAFGQPPLNGTLGVRYSRATPRRWWVDLDLRIVDRQNRVATTRLEQPTPGYETADLALGLEIGGRWRLEAGVRNLADETYADHLASFNPFTGLRVPEPGRSVHLGVEMAF